MTSTFNHTFRRRFYRHPFQLLADLRRLRSLRGSTGISPCFRERLMLVVTAVNRCRYCAAFHRQAAQLSGLSADEIALLLAGSMCDVPEIELPALLYAQQWSEAAGHANPALQAELYRIYGAEQARAIEHVLTMIWIGNLSGNTWDALLFWLSRGPPRAG